MGPRKKPRRENAGDSTQSQTPPLLQPSQATTSEPQSLSAVPRLSTSASTPTTTSTAASRGEADRGMPPPPLPKSVSNSKKDELRNKTGQEGNKVIQKTRSWYGSLSRKSTASLSVQRETIAGSPLKAGSTPDFHRYDLKRSGDTASLSGASQTSVNAPSNLQETTTFKSDSPAKNTSSSSAPDPAGQDVRNHETAGPVQQTGIAAAKSGSKDKDRTDANNDTPMPDAPPSSGGDTASTSTGWLGGWYPFGNRAVSSEIRPAEVEHASQTQVPTKDPKEAEPEPTSQNATASPPEQQQTTPVTADQQSAAPWFNFWTSAAASKDKGEESAKKAKPAPVKAHDTADVAMEDAPAPGIETTAKSTAPAGSTWAFWSRDRPKSSGKQPETPEQGQLAVMGEGSETHPKRANSTDMSREGLPKPGPAKDEATKAKGVKEKASKKTKRKKPSSMDLDEVPSRPQTPQSDTASIVTKTDSPSKFKIKTPTTATQSGPTNLLLPSFRGTYRMKENPSILKQITALLLRAQQPPTKHVYLTKDPPKIKKAIAIGVHGLFPATYLRPMIGQPTGTSIKFANHCADGIRRWADNHGCEECEIEKVALEGEGKIESRVTNLWKLLQNWMDHIREADLIVLACHSQGVPVAVMLLEKLIESGAVSKAKIGVCAMAGVNLGPFPDYKSGMGILMGSAAELWEFANSDSEVSKKYERSLKRVLGFGARITYVGSIDDQLVPMESAIYSPASHPYIYRAVFIDGRIHAPDFIAHLVGFACKLRNLGISDHGLIRELSVPLAGSLYGGEGHSRLYDDGQVYDLAIAHALETTDVGPIPCEIQKYDGPTTSNSNPYLLPWTMRGLLEEDLVKTELSAETRELILKFDDWKPTTKSLKDVRFRLEAVRSKL